MTDFICRLAAASLLAVAGGLPLVAPDGRPRLADLAAAWTLALGNAAVLALAAGLAGWILAPWVLALLLIAPGLAVGLLTKAGAAFAAPGRVARGGLARASAAAGTRPNQVAHLTRLGGAPGLAPLGGPALQATLGELSDPARWGRPPFLVRLGGPPRLARRDDPSGLAELGDPLGLARPGWRCGRIGLGWLPGLALAVAAVLSAAKLAAVPLWSWDHFAVWGVKARTMLPGGHLRLGFLGSLYQSRVDHPLGLPMAWLILTFGKAPDPAAFKVLHAGFAFALAVLLQAAVARITSSQEIGCAAAAVLVISPLFWDSEAVGLAELPLALWAVAAIYLLICGPVSPVRLPWASGLALGFLPWIKQEGLPLALLALAFCVLAIARPRSRRLAVPMAGRTTEPTADRAARPTRRLLTEPTARRAAGSATERRRWHGAASMLARGAALPLARWLALGVPAALLLAGAWAVQRWALPPGASFFAGAWFRRGIARLPELGSILRHCAADLVQPDWLGFWALLAAATCAAALRRRMRALALAAVVWCQVVVYMLTALFSYIAPHDHLSAAFFRICAPLLPLGLLAIAMALAPPAPAEAGPPSEGLL